MKSIEEYLGKRVLITDRRTGERFDVTVVEVSKSREFVRLWDGFRSQWVRPVEVEVLEELRKKRKVDSMERIASALERIANMLEWRQ